ncbi:MAG TPA: hypothetical protein VI142_02350 [Gaiellaceae bacterium]
MTAVEDIPTIEVEKSPDERRAALAQAVAQLEARGHTVEPRPDYQRVLVGHNPFREVLVHKRFGLRRYELVDVDKTGKVSVRDI